MLNSKNKLSGLGNENEMCLRSVGIRDVRIGWCVEKGSSIHSASDVVALT